MPVSAIYGLPGKGKSLFLAQYALTLSNKYKKSIVANFLFKPSHLAQLAKMMNLQWFCENVDKGIVYYINPNFGFQDLCLISDSVVIIDEVALYAPRRDGGTPQAIRNSLAMSRKLSQYIVFSCQYPGQIDEGLKDYVDEVFYCNGTTMWSDQLRNEALIMKSCRRFTQENFKVWYSDPKLKRNPVKSKILSNKAWQGIPNCIDAMTFASYDSFVDFRRMKSRLPESDAVADDYPYCNLTNKKNHKLDYWPEEVTIEPLIQEESLDALYNPVEEELEEDLYSQVNAGKTTFAAYSKRPPSRKQIEQDLTTRTRKLMIWRIWGNSLIQLHKHSKFMLKLYTSFPSKTLNGLLKVDKILYRISKGRYKHELLVIKFSAGLLGFLLFIQILKCF